MKSVLEAFAAQARWCDELGSPLTATLLRGAAAAGVGDPLWRTLLEWPGDPAEDALPLRIAGACHRLVLDGRAAALAAAYARPKLAARSLWPIAAQALADHPACLLEYLGSAPQTNEVGRSSALLAGLHEFVRRTGERPLELLELGASAGLNLSMDRYHHQLGGCALGAPRAVLRLQPDWRGGSPPAGVLRICRRRGCDLRPLNPAEPGQRQRLRSYVWAGQVERLRRLQQALDSLGEGSPEVDRADAVAWLVAQLANVPSQGAARVVYHSVFWGYLSPDQQTEVTGLIEAAGARADRSRPLAWLRLEPTEDKQRLVLRLRHWPAGDDIALAEAQAHGDWIRWFDAPT